MVALILLAKSLKAGKWHWIVALSKISIVFSLYSRVTLNSRDPIIRLGISSLPTNTHKTMKKYPLGLIQSTTQLQQLNAPNLQDSWVESSPLTFGHYSKYLQKNRRSNISWKHAAKLTFIENQIQTCIAIQSPQELEHWYSILGIHLAKNGDEKRIRTHLKDLLGTPDGLMMIDGEETKKETILVWFNLDSNRKTAFHTNGMFPPFSGHRKTQTIEMCSWSFEASTTMATNLHRIRRAT